MSAEAKTAPGIQQVQKLDPHPSPQYVSVYANNVQVTTNFFDTALIFSEALGIQDGVVSVEQKVRVVLSLPQMKLFALSLLQQIDGFEKRFSPIQLSAEVIPPELQGYLKAFDAGRDHEG
jgi:hypothetical protein